VVVLKSFPPEEILDMDNIMNRQSLDVIGVPHMFSMLFYWLFPASPRLTLITVSYLILSDLTWCDLVFLACL
jgi:hypothetical protein